MAAMTAVQKDAMRASMSAGHAGRPHILSPEVRAAIGASHRVSPKAIAARARIDKRPFIAAGHKAARRKHITGIECILREFLLPVLLPRRRIVAEHPVYTFLVDAYVPALRLAVEADGGYWHGREDTKQHDAIRDRCLAGRYGLTVVRFNERELNAWVAGDNPGEAFWRKVDLIQSMKG
jgi:very-short-patch-repair endonuclease